MMGNGLLLLNFDLVRAEVLELSRLRIAEVLKVSPADVEGFYESREGKFIPCFQIAAEKAAGIDPAQVREVMGAIVDKLGYMARERMNGMRKTRSDYSPILS